jgi:pyruvate kinase
MISKTTVDAAYRINASLIIVMTSTGGTALKMSKLKPPCGIVITSFKCSS